MNLNFTLTFTVLQVLVFVVVVVISFFALKSRKLSKSQKRVTELEIEMLNCHREILELQRNSTKYNTSEKPEFKVVSMGL